MDSGHDVSGTGLEPLVFTSDDLCMPPSNLSLQRQDETTPWVARLQLIGMFGMTS